MSRANEKEDKFVIKHVFKDVRNALYRDDEIIGPVEKHHGVEWKLRLAKFTALHGEYFDFHLDCVQTEQSCDWSIETEFDMFAGGKTIVEAADCLFSEENDTTEEWPQMNLSKYDEYTTNDEIAVEFHVTIKKITGIGKRNLRNFDQNAAEKFSDVVLVVGGEKFYVLKKFLAMHSTYFESMFSGNFSESEKPEIELKDVNPEHFQNFLELINGESFLNDYTVEGILHLADFFGAKTAIKRCQDFLFKRSDLPLKRKFSAAIKGGFENVKRKCLSEMMTKEDVKKVLPEDPAHFQPAVWAEIVGKLISLN